MEIPGTVKKNEIFFVVTQKQNFLKKSCTFTFLLPLKNRTFKFFYISCNGLVQLINKSIVFFIVIQKQKSLKSFIFHRVIWATQLEKSEKCFIFTLKRNRKYTYKNLITFLIKIRWKLQLTSIPIKQTSFKKDAVRWQLLLAVNAKKVVPYIVPISLPKETQKFKTIFKFALSDL